jgi:hypothetical protein
MSQQQQQQQLGGTRAGLLSCPSSMQLLVLPAVLKILLWRLTHVQRPRFLTLAMQPAALVMHVKQARRQSACWVQVCSQSRACTIWLHSTAFRCQLCNTAAAAAAAAVIADRYYYYYNSGLQQQYVLLGQDSLKVMHHHQCSSKHS